ncbi:MAG: DNA polymerase III subunit delta' [Flavobacteriia bacterium]
MIWKDIIGQEDIKKQLEHLIDSNQVPHAQLFTGLSGYGGLPISLAFSLALLGISSESSSGKPLGEKIHHPDFHFVYPVVKRGTEKVAYCSDYSSEWTAFLSESLYGNYNDWFEAIVEGNKQGLIGVNEIEKLHQKMHLKSYSGGNKVCVIWGTERMNKVASNKFLKILEEPPQNTYFILIAEDIEMLLPTLVSRCQLVNIPPITNKVLEASLSSEIKDKKSLVTQAEGDYRRLQRIVQNTNNKEFEALLIAGLRVAFKVKKDVNSIVKLMEWTGKLSQIGKEEQKAFLNYGVQFFRDAFLINYSLHKLVHYQTENDFDIEKIAPFITSNNIQDLISLFEISHYQILRNANAKMVFDNLGIQLSRCFF